MSNFILIRSKVRNFAVWKSAYDEHLPSRQNSGLSEKYLLQGADDPNEVIILFEAADLGRAKAFVESANLKEAMQKSGVVDKPDVYFLNGSEQSVAGRGAA